MGVLNITFWLQMNLNEMFKRVVIKMYGPNCVLCGKEATAIHHIWPKGMGGCDRNTRYNPLNGAPLCHGCHSNIHDVIGETAGRELITEKIPHLVYANHNIIKMHASSDAEVRRELQLLLDS